MRSFVVDELSADEVSRVTESLSEMNLKSSIERTFWFPIPKNLLTTEQLKHFEQCAPYAMAFIIEESSLHLEMLVRSRNNIHCQCMGYARPELRIHMIDYLEELLEDLGIKA